jgi:hypothetical protein
MVMIQWTWTFYLRSAASAMKKAGAKDLTKTDAVDNETQNRTIDGKIEQRLFKNALRCVTWVARWV